MPQVQPHVNPNLAQASRSLEPAFFFGGHVYACVFSQTYRLDYVPVPLSEDDAAGPVAEGSWLGYELARATCAELRATIESESAVKYLNSGHGTNVMMRLCAAAETERSACYARLGTLRNVAVGLFSSVQ